MLVCFHPPCLAVRLLSLPLVLGVVFLLAEEAWAFLSGDLATARGGRCRFGNTHQVACLQLQVLFLDLLFPFLEPRRNDDRDAWPASSVLFGHGQDEVVLNVPARLEWAVFAQLPRPKKFLELNVPLMHRRHLVAELVEYEAQLVDVLSLVDLNILELLGKSACVVMLLYLRGHVHLCSRSR